ncbi:MAG TPA: CPBP family intramembrane glutamic endopeptidase [Longimicrobiales bacterium]
MRARPWLLVLAAASAVAWVQLGGVPWAARLWTVVLLVAVPALMVMQGRALRDVKTLPRTQAYVSSIISLWVLGILTFAVARFSGYGLAQLGIAPAGIGRTLAIAAGLVAAAVAILFLFRFAGVREAPIMHELVPATPRERLWFVGVSISAGICEEVIYRGFLIHVLYGATGSLVIALLLSGGAFGVSHAYQQPAGALRATLLGLILAIPLLLDGSIVPSIVAHTAVDVLSGLWLAKYLLR